MFKIQPTHIDDPMLPCGVFKMASLSLRSTEHQTVNQAVRAAISKAVNKDYRHVIGLRCSEIIREDRGGPKNEKAPDMLWRLHKEWYAIWAEEQEEKKRAAKAEAKAAKGAKEDPYAVQKAS